MKIKTEGGQGGKRGHSNMAHRDHTETIKRECRSIRRRNDKTIIRKALETGEAP